MKTVEMVFEDCVAPSLATNKLNETKRVRELISLFPIFGIVVFLRSVRETYTSYKMREVL